jgi:UDP-N-acetyl-D-glucosamine dehydrogenase
MASVPLEPENYDCAVIVTDHHSIDYAEVVERAAVVVDLRNATRGIESDKVFRL